MKSLIALFFGSVIGCAVGYASNNLIELGSLRMWAVNGSGRLGIASKLDNGSSAIDLWPTTGSTATKDSIAEITLHRTAPGSFPMERFNISAMADGTDSRPNYYRFGVEGDTPENQRGIIFCFESFLGERASCRLMISRDGTFINDAPNEEPQRWRKL